jgi:predicted nuclease with TOPRIM domain
MKQHHLRERQELELKNAEQAEQIFKLENENTQLHAQVEKLVAEAKQSAAKIKTLEHHIKRIESEHAAELGAVQKELQVLKTDRAIADAAIVVGEIAFSFCRLLLEFVFADRFASPELDAEMQTATYRTTQECMRRDFAID